jgi:hypothetical protein
VTINNNPKLQIMRHTMTATSTLTEKEMAIINKVVKELLPNLCCFDELVETIRDHGVNITDEQLFELAATNEEVSLFIDHRGF